ncbi:NDR1/HIN1-like protein 1 [Capsella rubella]|uniref:NDR1/HIN1-like protein 1 n=1 Tax=Capsella rubella TaxID=81985 RepID=UPI000CD4B3A5|nr:NDR1/HIN1-like protein 1 [Capsella rubella]
MNAMYDPYTYKRRRCIISFVPVLVFLIICLFVPIISYVVIQPRVPRFVLEDLYVDSHSKNSSVIVKLSSTNPSHNTSVNYINMNLHIRVLGGFETERVFLGGTFQQKPRSTKTWEAVVAKNNDTGNPTGAFLVRHGEANGDVIADMKIQWKRGIFSPLKFGLQVTCPVLLNLKDLSYADTIRTMSTCSHHFQF